ncbi:MAG: L-lactate dehydrogenase [Ruminococcus sp.]|uniref:L-lactate dehydrogenase n=1 Tax=Ruminococcus sp. TaxID=41978 RepID=UPI0025E9D471|nr:L-lactate dehydrogenase [Ruminococcus sp.]MCR5601254.1 L-lactate dehydrogenase [Ruminococcus sp.]
MNKITIIGTGSVGSTIAYALSLLGVASEIVMIDINNEKALGEALDIRQGSPFCNPFTVYAGTYADAAGSDIVIITSGIARKPGQSRLELAQTNVNVLKSIIPEITRYAGETNYLIVSNPVDVMTYVFCKCSGIPDHNIIGSGTILDTSRLRTRISEYYKINQKNVHAYVLGEHGDSSFIPWSAANISNIPIEKFHESINGKETVMPTFDHNSVEEYVRKSGASVIERKGATFYAVSTSVCYICKCLLTGIDTTMTVSTMLHGEYGLDDICLSILNIIGNKGVQGKVMLPLTDDEIKQLHNSADCVRKVIDSINI